MSGFKTRFGLALAVTLIAIAPAKVMSAGAPFGPGLGVGPGVGVDPGWSRGHWFHGSHWGRDGWWWAVGPSWYWYQQPVYPYPPYPYDEPRSRNWDYTQLQQLGAPAQDRWYYCDDPKGYYPYIDECRHEWMIAPIPYTGYPVVGEQQYYCNDPAGYYPYVADCKREWRIVPSIIPPR